VRRLSQQIEQRGNEIGFDRQVEGAVARPVRRAVYKAGLLVARDGIYLGTAVNG